MKIIKTVFSFFNSQAIYPSLLHLQLVRFVLGTRINTAVHVKLNNLRMLFVFCIFSFFFHSRVSCEALHETGRNKDASNRAAESITVMISPAGDAQHRGRTIDTAFENQITLALAQALQNRIEQHSAIRVIISHGTHEAVKPLYQANFANRIGANLFLSLNCYQTELRPTLALYTFSYGSFTPSRLPDLAFYPYDQAHLLNADLTQKYAHGLDKALKNYTKQFDHIGLLAMPFKPLMGVKVPAIGIEVGIHDKNGWLNFVEPLATCIVETIQR